MSTQKKDVKIVTDYDKESFDQRVTNLEAIGYVAQPMVSNNTALNSAVMVREVNDSN